MLPSWGWLAFLVKQATGKRLTFSSKETEGLLMLFGVVWGGFCTLVHAFRVEYEYIVLCMIFLSWLTRVSWCFVFWVD